MMKKQVRRNLFTHNMNHDNPGYAKYDSAYTDPKFLKARGFDGKSFDLYNCAQYGLTWDGLTEKYNRPAVFPEGSEARDFILSRKAELQKLYQEAADEGLGVSFMMDTIVFPLSLLELYPEVLNEDGKIDIKKPMTMELYEAMFDEMFREFSQITGIYIRYGEVYCGPEFGHPYHTGHNPILGEAVDYHIHLINLLIDVVCKKHGKEIYYRSWGFGAFQNDPETYLAVSEQIEVHPKFYFCIKHTAGDFHRCSKFNQTLNIGKHQQIVEVQAAREYEGKGAYPNYIGDGVINGFEEFKWLMEEDETHGLRDVVNVEGSLVAGIWTWARGGGADGPYITGRNGVHGEVVVENGSELWCDLNTYVVTQWAKDTSKSDRHYVLQYAKEILGMSDKDAEIFYELCILSAKAVLYGRGCNNDKMSWNVWWTRDQNVSIRCFNENIKTALATDPELVLMEKQCSVDIWKDIVALAESLTTGNQKEYIVTTCKYGYYLYAITNAMYQANIYAALPGNEEKVADAVKNYHALWEKWIELKETAPGCPTLYAKEDVLQELICYATNYGFDSVMKF